MQYLRYLKQFFQIMFKVEHSKDVPVPMGDDSEGDEEPTPNSETEDELRTGGSKLLVTAVGIGYHNLTKTLI